MRHRNGSGPRRKWLRWAAGIPLFFGILYFVATAEWFVKAVILPMAGESIGSVITAESVSLNPWTSLRATGVRLAPKGGEPLLEVGALQARYSLVSILLGTIQVDELLVERPVVTVTTKKGKGGESNLDVWMKSLPRSASSKKSGAPPALAIRKVTVMGGTLRLDREEEDGRRFRAAVAGLDVSLDQLAPKMPSRTRVGASLEVETLGGVGDGKVVGRLDADVTTRLGGELALEGLAGAVRMELPDATGSLQRLKGLRATLDASVGATTLTNLTLAFSQNGTSLGQASVKGQVRLADSEARLAYEVQRLDARVLGLIGAAMGVDLGDAIVTASGRLDAMDRGNILATDGRLRVSGLSVGTARGRTKPVDVELQHRLSRNEQTRSFLVDQVDLTVMLAGNKLLVGALDNGLNISLDKSAPGFREATYTIQVSGLSVADWTALLPLDEPRGSLDLVAKARFDDAGRSCSLSLDVSGKGLGVTVGGRTYKDLGLTAKAAGRLKDFERANVDAFDVDVRAAGTRLATLHGLADAQISTGRTGMQVDLDVALKPILAVHPIDGFNIEGGTLKAGLMLSLRGGADQSDADLTVGLADVSGSIANLKLEDYQASVAATLARTGSAIAIRKLSVAGQTGVDLGGSIECVGTYDLATTAGRMDLKLIGVNESMIRPFLAPGMAPNRLVSVKLDLDAKADLSKEGKATAVGRFAVASLVVAHPDGRIPEVPLGLSLDFDASSDGRVTEVRRVTLALEPTARATNRVEVAAFLDLGTQSPQPSRLSVKSTPLDLTPIYDLLSSATNASKPSVSEGEPPAVALPFRQLTAELDVPRVFLHEIDVSDIRGKASVQDNVATLEGLAFRVNNAPVQAKAKVNLGRPGYDYALALSAEPIPITPIVNSFFPAMRGLTRGSVLASADVRGSGVTGASLRKSLAGHVEFRATNAEVRLPDEPIKLPSLLTRYLPILPPTLHPGAVLKLIGKSSVLAEPFRVIEARTDMGDGTVKVSNARLLSAAMGVAVGGDIRIADNLNQSALNLPISLAFASGGSLPSPRTVGTVVGSLEKTSFKPDVLGLTAVGASLSLPGIGNLGTKATDALKAAGSNLNQATGSALNKAGAAVDAALGADPKSPGGAFGGLIKGVLQPGANPANPATKPDTNAPAKPGILDLIPGGKGKK